MSQDSGAHTGISSDEPDTAAEASASKAPQQPDSQHRILQRQDSPGQVSTSAQTDTVPMAAALLSHQLNSLSRHGSKTAQLCLFRIRLEAGLLGGTLV